VSKVRLEIELDAPVEGVFDAMADHARYDRFRPISASELIQKGAIDRNGVGAVRRLRTGLLRFDEEVTAYERLRRLDYLIVDVNIPLEHEGGSIRFEPTESGTHVLWTSTFRITTPLIGGMLGAAFGVGLKRSFTRMLEDSARLASAPAESAART
jgi:Polyketide cyclase / dehydrase and lipid transport